MTIGLLPKTRLMPNVRTDSHEQRCRNGRRSANKKSIRKSISHSTWMLWEVRMIHSWRFFLHYLTKYFATKTTNENRNTGSKPHLLYHGLSIVSIQCCIIAVVQNSSTTEKECPFASAISEERNQNADGERWINYSQIFALWCVTKSWCVSAREQTHRVRFGR